MVAMPTMCNTGAILARRERGDRGDGEKTSDQQESHLVSISSRMEATVGPDPRWL